MQGVPEQFTDERDSARFRHLAQLPGRSFITPYISDYAFEPHTHEAFGIGTIETGAERFHIAGTQHLAAEKSVVTMNPDEIHTGNPPLKAAGATGWSTSNPTCWKRSLACVTGGLATSRVTIRCARNR